LGVVLALREPGQLAEQEAGVLLATVGKLVEQAALLLGQGMDGGDAALGIQVGKRHVKPLQNSLGHHAQVGSLGFPIEAALGIRLIDGPSQVVSTHQAPMGAENQQRQDHHRRLPQGVAYHRRGAGIPPGLEEHFPAMDQVAIRGTGFKPVPIQGLGPDGVVPVKIPQLDGRQSVPRGGLQTAAGGVA